MPRKATGDVGDSLERKRKQYELDSALRDDDDESPDLGRLLSMQTMKAARARKQLQHTADGGGDKELPRSLSDSSAALPSTVSSKMARHNSDRAKTSTDGPPRQSQLETRKTFSGEPSKPMTEVVPSSSPGKKTIGKRKRDTGVPHIPDEQKIFNGLHFYFFPNSDKHKARKARIEKATLYGAIWEQEFNHRVTHIVADTGYDFASLMKFIKVDSLPSTIILVTERYPSDCLTHRKLLDPRQPEYKVKGHEIPATPTPASSASEPSLQLHPARRNVQSRRPETPSEDSQDTSSPQSRLKLPSKLVEDRPSAEEVERPFEGAITSTEEFDAVIKQARELQYVPLDNDDDPKTRPTSSGGPETDEEGEGSGLKLVKQKSTLFKRKQDSFQCMQKHTGTDDYPNAETIAILQQMATYYDQIGDEWRPRAYRKAISTLRNHPTKVWSREEALALPQIGERLATKIEEIALTSRLRRLDNAIAEPNDQILRTFMQVYGAGPAQASKWVNAGYTTLDELRVKATLTENQRIGIDHYEDFNSRIPRAEVEKHGAFVRNALQSIDPVFEVIVGGSYRRGAATSGDIDCIITRPNTGMEHIRTIVLEQLVPQLFAEGFLAAGLATTSHDDGSKWHGASQLPSASSDNPWRRIDLLLVPSDQLGAALIYFTGNDIFNRSLRLLASTKGMRLNQRGLYKNVIRGKGREKITEGTLVEGKSERRIFEVLEVPWRPPEHRIC